MAHFEIRNDQDLELVRVSVWYSPVFVLLLDLPF